MNETIKILDSWKKAGWEPKSLESISIIAAGSPVALENPDSSWINIKDIVNKDDLVANIFDRAEATEGGDRGGHTRLEYLKMIAKDLP